MKEAAYGRIDVDRIGYDKLSVTQELAITPSGIVFATNLPALGPSRTLRGFWTPVAFVLFGYGPAVGLRVSRYIVEPPGDCLWLVDNALQGMSFYPSRPTSVEAHE